MHHDLLRDVEFWRILFSIDRDSARIAREKGCVCDGRLHSAKYRRQPRGGPDQLPEECCVQFSFCCERDGCRKRVTPPSARFLGRKVYLLPVIFLAAAMRQGPSPRAMRELTAVFSADRRTIARWQELWCEQFPRTQFWKLAKARISPVPEPTHLPRALLDAFFLGEDAQKDWERLLKFLQPITIAGGLAIEVPR